jgi:hypothetical protein
MAASSDGPAQSQAGTPTGTTAAAPDSTPTPVAGTAPGDSTDSSSLSAAGDAAPTAAEVSQTFRRAGSTGWQALTNLFTGLWGLVNAVPLSILAFAALWVFVFFPWLRPWEPPVERRVSITDLVLGERDKDLGDDRLVDVIYFVVKAFGYDADDIAVEWLEYDVQTRQRLAEMPTPQYWGVIDFDTRSDRVIGEINVPPPEDHPGCVFVRVFLWPDRANGDSALLDAADTAAFDPLDSANPACADGTPAVPPLR